MSEALVVWTSFDIEGLHCSCLLAESCSRELREACSVGTVCLSDNLELRVSCAEVQCLLFGNLKAMVRPLPLNAVLGGATHYQVFLKDNQRHWLPSCQESEAGTVVEARCFATACNVICQTLSNCPLQLAILCNLYILAFPWVFISFLFPSMTCSTL